MKLSDVESFFNVSGLTNSLINQGVYFGLIILKAAAIFFVGRLVINLVNKLVKRLLNKRNIDPSIKTFLSSMINVLLVVLLLISIIGALGVETTSFAALLASAGIAIGMALSGNLSNFAGGLLILLFKPFRVHDYIVAQGTEGSVQEIQIFHTVLRTIDNKLVYVPNGALSSGVVTNFNVDRRRIEWIFGVDYGTNYEQAKGIVNSLLKSDSRVLADPEPFVALHALADSSVNIVVRVWVKAPDYWGVYFDFNRQLYENFNAAGISFPFPQLTVHSAK
ncbi:MAG: mechanosensitive ion channel [Tannerellaceae bacterium]|jgi:small conductance mechanosensitive channel|nr:mechanosensitive ion channel [Tannerellaceae bacterium]